MDVLMMETGFSAAALPRLRSPFSDVLHELAPAVQVRTLAWAERFGLTRDPAVRARLASTRGARLTARVSAHSTPDGLQLHTDWQTWLFLFDDAYCDESELGKHPAAVIEIAARVQAVLETGQPQAWDPPGAESRSVSGADDGAEGARANAGAGDGEATDAVANAGAGAGDGEATDADTGAGDRRNSSAGTSANPAVEQSTARCFLTALADLRARLAAMASRAQFDRFTAGVTGYLLALTWEAAQRERRRPSALHEYRVMRRHSGAVPTCIALIDVVNGFEMPGPVWHDPALRAATDAMVDIVSWANDILSYPKELTRSGQVLGLPAVLAGERGLTAPAALAEAARMYDERIAQYLRLEAPLLAAGDPAVARYLRDLRSWIAGNLAWSYETGRYGLEFEA